MKQYSLVILLLTVMCFNNSCKEKSNTPASKTQLITSATWKYDKAMIDLNKDGTGETPLPAGFVESCESDNLLIFKSDGTGTIDEGGTKCDAGDPQTTAFTWSFSNNETVVNFPSTIFTGISGDVKINSLTDTKMQLQKEVNIGFPQTVNIIVDLKH